MLWRRIIFRSHGTTEFCRDMKCCERWPQTPDPTQDKFEIWIFLKYSILMKINSNIVIQCSLRGSQCISGVGFHITDIIIEMALFLEGNIEDGDHNQYWYSEKTIAKIVEAIVGKGGKVAFLSTPSLYFSVPADIQADAHVFDVSKICGMWNDVNYAFTACRLQKQ